MTDWMWCMENPKEAAAEIDKLRAALSEVASCVQLLGLDGWSDAPHVMGVITKALNNEQQ